MGCWKGFGWRFCLGAGRDLGMRKGRGRDLVAGMLLLLAPLGCRKAEEDPDQRGGQQEADGGGAPSPYSQVNPAESRQREPSKRPRAEGRTPDGRAVLKKGFKVGRPVPGKAGFVFNPWTNNVVDVRGLPPGTLVRDPVDSDQTHKFRVPKTTAPDEGKE